MFFDGAGAKTNNGGGMVVASPTQETTSFATRLRFVCAKDIGEYEALLKWFEIARATGIQLLQVHGDVELIIKRIKGHCQAKNLRLKQY
jgi:ribonuclease HI